MSSSFPLQVKDLSKTYRLYSKPIDRLKQFFIESTGKKLYQSFSALEPISFKVKAGQCLGIIGRNGSGKSTLLQLLAGTLTPSSGTVFSEGRIAAILELGAGFNIEFSGHDNIFLNASLLGFSKEEVEKAYQEIVDFAEIANFIDQPVKTYSSGMYVRLAFSIAIHVNPQILIVDEALAVGDAPFQYKCLQKIEEIKARGACIVFVSHDLGAVKRFCDQAIWINNGKMEATGECSEVVDQYESFLREQMPHQTEEDLKNDSSEKENVQANYITPVGTHTSEPDESFHAMLLDAKLVDEKNTFQTFEDLSLEIKYKVLKEAEPISVGVAIYRNDHLCICAVNTKLDNYRVASSLGEHIINIDYSNLRLLPGKYYFKIGIFDVDANVTWDFEHRTCDFEVKSKYVGEGVALLKHSWRSQS